MKEIKAVNGAILVSTIEDAVRIRSRERGERAL